MMESRQMPSVNSWVDKKVTEVKEAIDDWKIVVPDSPRNTNPSNPEIKKNPFVFPSLI